AFGSFRWYLAQEPASSLFMNGHAFGFTGVSPKRSACCASGFGCVTYFIQRYAQFGCFAFLAIIHVSAQPVACFGLISPTATFFFWRFSVSTGHAAASETSPAANAERASVS